MAKEQVNQVARFRIFPESLRSIRFLLKNQLGLILIQIRWGDFAGERCLDQLLLTVVTHPLRLEVGTKPTNANNAGQALQINRSRGAWVDIPLPLMHLGFKALFALVKPFEIGKPLHFAVGDLIEGVLHPCREAGIHQIGEMLLQQGRYSKSGKARGQGVSLNRCVAAINNGANDRGIGGWSSNAFFFQHLHQGRFAKSSGRLGLMPQGIHVFRLRLIPDREGRQQHLLPLESGVRIITSLDIGAEKPRKIDALAIGSETRIS